MDFDPGAYLKKLPSLADEDIDLGLTCIALAAPAHPGLSLERYIHHLLKLENQTRTEYEILLENGTDGADLKLDALCAAIAGENEYEGDEDTYDDLQNADLIRVIERRKGLPVSLGILYIRTGRALGWDVEGLHFPGHFICALSDGAERILFDPFDQAKVLQAADLRGLLKTSMGESAELSADYYQPAPHRAILMRLQNNIKFRQIESEDYSEALKTVELMRLVDPDEYRLCLDAGVLFARLDQLDKAIENLESYMDQAPGEQDIHDAAILLQQLREQV